MAPPGRTRVILGALLLVCTAQYFVAELVAAAAWDDPAYSWTDDYISDLAATGCGPDLCSPNHLVVEISVLVHASVVGPAAWLLSGLLGSPRASVAVRGLASSHVAGILVVAYDPLTAAGSEHGLHYLGAGLAMVAATALVGLVGAVLLRNRRTALGGFSLCCSGVALSGIVLVRWDAARDARLPGGLLERMAVDPIVVWCVVVGAVVGLATLRRRNVPVAPDGRAEWRRLSRHAGGTEDWLHSPTTGLAGSNPRDRSRPGEGADVR